MPSDDAVILLFLSVELLAKIPHFIAVCLGGMFCLFFQSLDFFPALSEFGFKPLGLTPREKVGEIAEIILAASCWNLASTSSHTADFFSVLALSASRHQVIRSAML